MSNRNALTERRPSTAGAPLWLARWMVAHPAPVPKAAVERALDQALQAMAPATPAQIAARLEMAFVLFRRPENFIDQQPAYLRALEDIPPDLLDQAMRQVEKKCKFLPTPAEIRVFIEDQLTERMVTAKRLEICLNNGRFNEGART